jgi:hypothetical protein
MYYEISTDGVCVSSLLEDEEVSVTEFKDLPESIDEDDVYVVFTDNDAERAEILTKYAVDLEQLCSALNVVDNSLLDLSDLPTYGEYDGDTSDIYSWDDEKFLVYGAGWELISREED